MDHKHIFSKQTLSLVIQHSSQQMVETLDLTFIPANLCLNPFGFQNVHIVLNLVSKYLKHEYPELPVDR